MQDFPMENLMSWHFYLWFFVPKDYGEGLGVEAKTA
jgi:hypothetical protein